MKVLNGLISIKKNQFVTVETEYARAGFRDINEAEALLKKLGVFKKPSHWYVQDSATIIANQAKAKELLATAREWHAKGWDAIIGIGFHALDAVFRNGPVNTHIVLYRNNVERDRVSFN